MRSTVSLVIPCYNASKHITETIIQADRILRENSERYEIIIAEDGSTDGTTEIVREIATKHSHVYHNHKKHRQGKGKALENAFNEANGQILIFMDADSSISPSNLPEIIDKIKQGYDICTGIRKHEQRKLSRRITSLIFNSIARRLLETMNTDHQCGFKAFKAEIIKDLMGDTRETGWLWDAEILMLAQQKRYTIHELPVNWKPCKETSINLLVDPLKMLIGLYRLRKNHEKRANEKLIKTREKATETP